MKKYVNGKYVKMTKAEIEEMKAKMPPVPEHVKTEFEERVERVEQFISKIKSMFNID